MVDGNNLWSPTVAEGMVEQRLPGDKVIYTYSNLPKNVYESFWRTAQKLPEKVAIVDNEGKEYSYKDILKKVDVFSLWIFKEKKVRKGNHVALMLYNSIEFCVAYLALNRLGVVVIPLPTKYREEEIHSLLEKADVDFIISSENFSHYFSNFEGQGVGLFKIEESISQYGFQNLTASMSDAKLREYEKEVVSSDPTLLMFTSGTTSRSKGVLLHNYNVMHAIVSYERTLAIKENERALLPIPIYLVTGLVAVFGLMMHVGGTVYLNRKFEAKRVLADICEHKITFFHASPTVFTLLLSEKANKWDLSSLRMFACGSSNMPPEKIRMLKSWIPQCEFRTIYGLTETTSPGTVFPMDANKSEFIGSSGIPVPGMKVKITDSKGSEVERGVEGSVWVKGSNVTESYYRVVTDTFHEGWLNTGDIGYLNKAGYLYIVDRQKDMINRGGEKICSFDVENALLCIEDVEDAAVVGIPHEIYGEVPVAVVRIAPASNITANEIKEALTNKMAKYKVPERIVFVDQIPLTENLKVNKREIRELFNY